MFFFPSAYTESTNTDGLPQGPKTISRQHALGGPILAQIATVDCRRDSIRVTLPRNIIRDFFQLADENVMLRDSSCRAENFDSDLVLETGLDECGTKEIREEGKIIYENEVH